MNGFIYWQTVRARLMVYLNNKPVRDLWNDGAEEYQNGRELTSFWTFEMNKGDTMIGNTFRELAELNAMQ